RLADNDAEVVVLHEGGDGNGVRVGLPVDHYEHLARKAPARTRRSLRDVEVDHFADPAASIEVCELPRYGSGGLRVVRNSRSIGSDGLLAHFDLELRCEAERFVGE